MPEYSQGRVERLSEDETAPTALNERMDPASREVWVTDCYIKLDEDGGIEIYVAAEKPDQVPKLGL